MPEVVLTPVGVVKRWRRRQALAAALSCVQKTLMAERAVKCYNNGCVASRKGPCGPCAAQRVGKLEKLGDNNYDICIRRAPHMALNKRWHAVSIAPPTTCCELVKSLRSTRFLSAEAPRLPLSACTMPSSCTCAYRHHDDRRVRARRAIELHGVRRFHWTQENRRLLEDRRAPE